MNIAAWVWLGLIALFLIIEAACPIHLVSIWFAAGAFVAMVAALLGAQLWLQIILFIVVSCALLVCLWPFIKKVLNPHLTKTNVDAIVGTMGRVTVAIDNISATGQVKLGAMEWTARSSSGKPIEEGTLIQVDRIEGVKVFVTPAEISAEV